LEAPLPDSSLATKGEVVGTTKATTASGGIARARDNDEVEWNEVMTSQSSYDCTSWNCSMRVIVVFQTIIFGKINHIEKK